MQENMDKDYYNKMIEAFIDKPSKTLWYQNAFEKFNLHGVSRPKWHWSWWAFGGGAAFLLYRKQYLAAFILFFVSISLGMIPFLSIIIMILAGGYSTYFIYKGFRKKLEEIEQNIEDEETRIETMRAVGGYHSWVVWVYGILSALFFFVVIFAITTIIEAPSI